MWTQGRKFYVHKYMNIVDIIVCTTGNAVFALDPLLIPYSNSSQCAASYNYLTWKRLMNISCKEVSMFYCHGVGKFKNSASWSCFGFSVANCVSFYVHNKKYDEEYKWPLYRKENRNRQTIKRAILRALQNRCYHKHDYHFGLTRFVQRTKPSAAKRHVNTVSKFQGFEDFFFSIIRVRCNFFFFCKYRIDNMLVLYVRV